MPAFLTPEAAVWLSRDSYVVASPELVISTPQLGAMYSFEFGNPYKWRDTNGHDPKANDAPHGFWGQMGAGLEIDMQTGRAVAHQSDFGEAYAKVSVGILTGVGVYSMRGYLIKAAVGLGVFKAIELDMCRPPSSDPATLDVFGGAHSQIPGAINADLAAKSGVCCDVTSLPFKDAAFEKVVASGPRANFLPEAARVLKAGGKIYINATQGNKFAKLPSAAALEALKLRVVQDAGPLLDQFKNMVFRRTDGSVIPIGSVTTTVLEKLP